MLMLLGVTVEYRYTTPGYLLRILSIFLVVSAALTSVVPPSVVAATVIFPLSEESKKLVLMKLRRSKLPKNIAVARAMVLILCFSAALRIPV